MKFYQLLGGLFLLSLTTCNQPLNKRAILVLGDSNGEREGWVYQLQQLRGGGPLVNTSISGNTVAYKYDGGDRLNTLSQLTPYLRKGYAEMGAIDEILIGLGTNDCKVRFGQDADDIAANLGKVLDGINSFFADRGQEAPRIVILSPPPLDDTDVVEDFKGATACTEAVTEAYRALATSRGHCYVDLTTNPGTGVLAHSYDGIHFKQEGYVMLAEAVLDACY